MITLKCDNCEKTIEVEASAAGKKVKCPHCGDINVTKAADPKDRAGAKGLPPDSGPEESVLKVRPEMFRARPLLYLGHVVVLLAGAAGGIYFGLVEYHATMLIVSLLATAAIGVSFGVWKVRNLGSSIEVTNKRTIERLGLFSRFTSEILHEDVRNVQITQSFPERLMGVGRIGISSAGQEGLEITVKDIRNPDKIRELIDLYRPM